MFKGLLQSDRICFTFSYFSLIFVFVYQMVTQLASVLVPRWIYTKKKNIKGQNVLITGAGSGLGRQLAVEFSKQATCLILVDINEQSLLETAELLDDRSTVHTYKCDVSNHNKVCEMAKKVKMDVGDVDILVNNAGVFSGAGKYFVDLPEDSINRTMAVNTMAHFWTTKAFLPAMMERNSGHVVSITSIIGILPIPRTTDYCASKSAAIVFAKSLEVELRERKLDGIKVTIVCPSHMDTGLFEGADSHFGQTLTPEKAAKLVVLAVLEEREYLYMPYFMHIVSILVQCVPRSVLMKFMELNGTMKAMENFTAKEIIEENKFN